MKCTSYKIAIHFKVEDISGPGIAAADDFLEQMKKSLSLKHNENTSSVMLSRDFFGVEFLIFGYDTDLPDETAIRGMISECIPAGVTLIDGIEIQPCDHQNTLQLVKKNSSKICKNVAEPYIKAFDEAAGEPAGKPGDQAKAESGGSGTDGASQQAQADQRNMPCAEHVRNSAEGDKGFSGNVVDEIMTEIDHLICVEDYKKLAREWIVISENRNRIAPEIPIYQNYLFSIDPGNGLTTVLMQSSRLLKALNLFAFSSNELFYEFQLEKPNDPNADFYSVELKRILMDDRFHGIVCLDISKWMDSVDDDRYNSFLNIAWKERNRLLFVFRIPYVERRISQMIHTRLSDRINVKLVEFVPPSEEQLAKYASTYVAKYGMKWDESANSGFVKALIEEKRDGRFYGIHTVEKLINTTIYSKLCLPDSAGNKLDNRIKQADVSVLTSDHEIDDNLTGLEQLDSMVGLSAIKQRVKEILAAVKLQKSQDFSDRASMHMVFTGNPGTGKTIVARLLGKIFKEHGILPIGNLIEVSRKDLVGMYVGHTAPKTAQLCKAAYGSILFIDEAYLLSAHEHSNDFAAEALGTLIAEMENNRDRFIVIMAGYASEMEKLLQSNPGLSSRIPYHLDFPNYSGDELFEIFRMQTSKQYRMGDEVLNMSGNYFRSIDTEVLQSRDFGNGRFIRNLFERIRSKLAIRVQMQGCYLNGQAYEILVSDFQQAVSDHDIAVMFQKANAVRIGFNA